MERTGIKIFSPFGFLQNLPEYTQFACKNYPDKKLIYFEIFINKDAKLVCKIEPKMYSRIISGKEAEVLTIEHFGITAVVGNITIRDIMRDAIPDSDVPSLRNYFFQCSNSKYKHDDPLYPVGLACGYFRILVRSTNRIQFLLNDFGNRISGIYSALIKNEKLVLRRLTF